MAGESIGGLNPITAVFTAGSLLSGKKKPDPIVGLKRSGGWNSPEAIEMEINRWENTETRGPKMEGIKQRTLDQLYKRYDELSPGTPPGDPDLYEPGEIILDEPADVPLSPVFGAPVILGAGPSMTDAILKNIRKLDQASGRAAASRAESRRYRAAEKSLKKKVGPSASKAVGYAAKELIRIAQRDYPAAAKLIKQGSKLLKKVKPSAVGRLGGLGGVVASLGGQYAIEGLSKAVEKAQFENMTKILKEQDAEANRRYHAVKSAQSKAQTVPRAKVAAATAPPKAPTPAKPVKSIEPPRPTPVITPRPGGAVGPPKSLQKQAKISSPRPQVLAPVKVAKPTLPTVKAPAPSKIGPFISNVIQGSALLNALKSGKTTAGSASTLVAQTQTSAFRSPPSVPTSTREALCDCAPKRKKSTGKKRKGPPRVCVTEKQARDEGFWGKIKQLRKRKT